MQDDNEMNVAETQSNDDVIAALQELKAANLSLQKERDNAIQDRKKILKSFVDGGDLPEAESKSRTVEELRDVLFSGKPVTNLEFLEASVELRDRILEEEGKDIFLPQGHEYVMTDTDVNGADKVTKVIKECVENSEGNPDVFIKELMLRTNESPMSLNKKKR